MDERYGHENEYGHEKLLTVQYSPAESHETPGMKGIYTNKK